MKPVLIIVLVGVLVALAGCGGFAFQANSNLGNTTVASGVVSFFQFTAILDRNGSLVNVTVVTLVQGGLGQTFTFCGTQNGIFTINQNMRVTFAPAATCANLIVAVDL